MRRYLLDTSVLINFSKQNEPTMSKLIALLESDAEIGICSITIAEFFAGIPPQLRQEWTEFFATLHYWDVSFKAAQRAGSFRYDYQKQGKHLQIIDALIAAVGKDVGATIVIRNVKDFPMLDIDILSLQQGII